MINLKNKFVVMDKKQEHIKIEHQENYEALGKDKQAQNKKNKRDFILYYSSYGYIKINQSEINKNNKLLKFIQYRQIPFKPEDCLRGTIYLDNIKKEINIQIKTFFNERKIYKIEKININSPPHLAVQKLFEQKKTEAENTTKKDKIELITSQSQYRIFSCNKNIHQLNPIECIYENAIKDNELLLYLPIKELSFSEFLRGTSILISKEGKIASKVNTDNPQYILGNLFYCFGKHYFEVNLLTEPIDTSIIIGVATKKNPFNNYIFDVNNFYGIISSVTQKFYKINGKEEKKDFVKDSFTINDIVGVLLEFKKEGLEISFYKNKICLGVAYSKIKNDKIFYPAVILGIAGSKVQISNQIDFP